MTFAKKLQITFREWHRKNPAIIAAGLAYFTLFSLIPSFFIAISLAGKIFAKSSGKDFVIGELANLFSPEVASFVQSFLAAADKMAKGATLFSTVVLVWVATKIFTHLQDAVNAVWGIKHSDHDFLKRITSRFRAWAMIAVLSVIVAAFFGLDWVLRIFRPTLIHYFPIIVAQRILPGLAQIFAFGMLTTLFALVYKLMPDVKLAWRHVWRGAFLAACMYAIVRFIILFYFSVSKVGPLYGAARSVVVLLIWVYFSMQILLFGAHYVRVISDPAVGGRN